MRPELEKKLRPYTFFIDHTNMLIPLKRPDVEAQLPIVSLEDLFHLFHCTHITPGTRPTLKELKKAFALHLDLPDLITSLASYIEGLVLEGHKLTPKDLPFLKAPETLCSSDNDEGWEVVDSDEIPLTTDALEELIFLALKRKYYLHENYTFNAANHSTQHFFALHPEAFFKLSESQQRDITKQFLHGTNHLEICLFTPDTHPMRQHLLKDLSPQDTTALEEALHQNPSPTGDFASPFQKVLALDIPAITHAFIRTLHPDIDKDPEPFLSWHWICQKSQKEYHQAVLALCQMSIEKGTLGPLKRTLTTQTPNASTNDTYLALNFYSSSVVPPSKENPLYQIFREFIDTNHLDVLLEMLHSEVPKQNHSHFSSLFSSHRLGNTAQTVCQAFIDTGHIDELITLLHAPYQRDSEHSHLFYLCKHAEYQTIEGVCLAFLEAGLLDELTTLLTKPHDIAKQKRLEDSTPTHAHDEEALEASMARFSSFELIFYFNGPYQHTKTFGLTNAFHQTNHLLTLKVLLNTHIPHLQKSGLHSDILTQMQDMLSHIERKLSPKASTSYQTLFASPRTPEIPTSIPPASQMTPKSPK